MIKEIINIKIANMKLKIYFRINMIYADFFIVFYGPQMNILDTDLEI